MMLNYRKLASSAMKEAMIVREKLNLQLESPISIYDAAEKLGVEVILCKVGSFEGMYEKNTKTILLSSERPEGRKVFTCGHELGHWRYDHGNRLDLKEYLEKKQVSEEEYLADIFSSYLLMPPWGIEKAFRDRAWKIEAPSPVQVFTVASQFAVSYESLTTHMHFNMKCIANSQYKILNSVSPKAIRKSIHPSGTSQSLIVTDAFWASKTIDATVGAVIIVPEGIQIEGECLSLVGNDDKKWVHGVTPGIGRIIGSSWSAFVRVSRPSYHGRARFRHLEETEE